MTNIHSSSNPEGDSNYNNDPGEGEKAIKPVGEVTKQSSDIDLKTVVGPKLDGLKSSVVTQEKSDFKLGFKEGKEKAIKDFSFLFVDLLGGVLTFKFLKKSWRQNTWAGLKSFLSLQN